jgi:hypothetical protein
MRGVSLAVLLGLGLLGAAGQPDKGPKWLTDIDATRTAARASNRPILAILW